MEKEYLESFEAYADAIFRFAAFQLSDREAGKDVAQDVFLNTWKYLADGGEIDNMRAFLYTAARHRIIDRRRKKRGESLEILEEGGFEPRDETAHRSIEERAEAERVFHEIGKMEEGVREPLLLRFAEGLSVHEIAEIMGESENVISVRIHRALKKLRSTLGISEQKQQDTEAKRSQKQESEKIK